MNKLSHLLASVVTALSVSGCSTPEVKTAKDIDDGFERDSAKTLKDGTKVTTLKNGCVVTETGNGTGNYKGVMECPPGSEL